MTERPRLSDAIEQYLAFQKSNGLRPATIRSHGHILRRLYLVAGDVYPASINDAHINAYFQTSAASRAAASLGIDHSTLNRFFAWCIRSRLIRSQDNPMAGRKAPKPMPVERDRVAMKDFPRLLDAAGSHHPRDRIVVALGLYLFLRGSEVCDLRIGDLSLDAGEIRTRMFKTSEVDVMPISEELDTELRVWLRYYSTEQGPLNPSWFLAPAKRPPKWAGGNTRGLDRITDRLLVPLRKIVKVEDIPKRALEDIGYQIRGTDGVSRREGMHTLRRSGARARFDTLRDRGYDGALRHVQTMLHHKNSTETERYIGLTLDRVKRNELVKGLPMYPSLQEAEVVSIHAHAVEQSG
jgi:integrase